MGNDEVYFIQDDIIIPFTEGRILFCNSIERKSPVIATKYVEMESSDGLGDGESTYEPFGIELMVTLFYDSMFDKELLQHEMFLKLYPRTAFYLVYDKMPGKKFKVRTSSCTPLEAHNTHTVYQIELNVFEGCAESLGSTQTTKEVLFDTWQFQQGLIAEDYDYTFNNSNFTVHNLGDFTIDPREHFLKITLKGDSDGNIEIYNQTTSDRYIFKQTLSRLKEETLEIEEVYTYKNGVRCGIDTNGQLIRLVPGPNKIEVIAHHRNKKEIVSDFDRSSFYFNHQVNEKYEIGFAVSQTKKNVPAYELLSFENLVLYDGQEYVIKKLTEIGSGEQVWKMILATHTSFSIQDKWQYNELTGTLSINQCLSHVFSVAPDFTYEVVNTNGIFGRVEQENFGNANCKQLIEEVLQDYEAVVIRDNNHFTFFPEQYVGKKVEEVIRYKYNTDSIQFDIDTYELKTQIMGFGKRKDPKEGQKEGEYYFSPITYTSTESSKWGIRVQEPVEDERYTVASNMKKRLVKDLKDKPDITGTVTLNKLTNVSIFDKVRFVYEPLGINEFIKIVGIKTYPLVQGIPEVTLENNQATLTKFLVQMSRRRK